MFLYKSPEFYLPHRPPILLIEVVKSITDTQVICKTQTGKNGLLAPYTDEHGFCSTAFLMEIMAQSIGVWAGYQRQNWDIKDPNEKDSGTGLLLSVRSLKFYVNELVPDLILEIEMNRQMQDGNLACFEGLVKNENTVLCSGKITAFSPSLNQLQNIFKNKNGY